MKQVNGYSSGYDDGFSDGYKSGEQDGFNNGMQDKRLLVERDLNGADTLISASLSHIKNECDKIEEALNDLRALIEDS